MNSGMNLNGTVIHFECNNCHGVCSMYYKDKIYEKIDLAQEPDMSGECMCDSPDLRVGRNDYFVDGQREYGINEIKD